MTYLTSLYPQWAFSYLKILGGLFRRRSGRLCFTRARARPFRWLLGSTYDREPLSPFLLFPIEGLLELHAKEGRKFFGGNLETAKLVSRHLDRVAAGIGHRALWCAARVARTGMYAH